MSVWSSLSFTGKERDYETGLDYFGARYFLGAQGRFNGPDEPLVDQNAGDPQSWNLYSYSRNNPLRNLDRDGRACSSVTGADGSIAITDTDGKGCGALYDTKVAYTLTNLDYAAEQFGIVARRTEGPVNLLGIGAGIIATGGGFGMAGGIGGLVELGVASGPLVGVGLTPQAKAYAEELIAGGQKVVALPTNSVTKMADFVINGIVTEYKGLTAAGPTTVKNAIEKAAQQGKEIVIDARKVGITAQNALQ